MPKGVIMRFDTSNRREARDDFNSFVNFLNRENKTNAKSNTESPSLPKNTKSLAMVYPVKQDFSKIYDSEIALINGTIFEELNKPFLKSSCKGKSSFGEGCL